MKNISIRIIVVLTIVIMLTGCSAKPVDARRAEKGSINLAGWDFNHNGNVMLDGEWEFYWHRLLSFEALGTVKPDLFSIVPSIWNRYEIDGKGLSGHGYATYRLHVRTGQREGDTLGLRLYNFSSAYQLFINDKLVAANGKVSETASGEVGEYRPQAVFFSVPASEFDIIIHVSNFEYARGGFWYSIYLGNEEGISNLHDLSIGKEIFIVGALIVVALLYLAIYILQRELRYSLYFCCFCLSTAVGLDTVGQFLLMRIIPNMTLQTFILIWYSATTWVVFFFVLFVHELFKSKFSAAVTKLILAAAAIFQVIYFFTSLDFYSELADASNVIDSVSVLSAVVIVAIGIKKGYKDGWLNVAGMIVLIAAYLHDMLFLSNRIYSSAGELIYLGLFIFIFLQMVIQAKRIKSFNENKTAAELSFLQAQIKPHFLYNAINTFVSISRYDIDQARELLMEFGQYLRRSFDFKNPSQFVPLKNELEFAKAYVHIEKARFEERLEVNFDVEDDLEVKVPILMLQPVIENAINHGVLPKPEGGRVEVSIKRERNAVKFSVKDNGTGMDLRRIDFTKRSKSGTGVGLFNLNQRLKKIYGKGFDISSTPGSGTAVSWSIHVGGRGK